MYLLFDTETTGLLLHPQARLEKQPHIIEWGSIMLDDDGVVLKERSELFKPPIQISAEITKITGITNEAVADMPLFCDYLKDLRQDFEMAGTIFAHNLPFDKRMLLNELLRAGITDWPWPAEQICTVQEFSESWGTFPKLAALHEHFTGQLLFQKHRALDDVRALAAACHKAGLFRRFHDDRV